jgi:hypothetical protein
MPFINDATLLFFYEKTEQEISFQKIHTNFDVYHCCISKLLIFTEGIRLHQADYYLEQPGSKGLRARTEAANFVAHVFIIVIISFLKSNLKLFFIHFIAMTVIKLFG